MCDGNCKACKQNRTQAEHDSMPIIIRKGTGEANRVTESSVAKEKADMVDEK